MKFKELTPDQINIARDVYCNKQMSWDERMRILMGLFNKSERTVRKWCSERLKFKEKDEVESEQYELAKQKVIDKSKKRFLISWGQNDTSIHTGLLNNMKAYAEFIDADIHIIAGRYRNPTSINADKSSDIWDDKIVPYLDANRHDVHKFLSILSDVKIQPTATNPMSSLQGMSGINSCIFGSPKVQLETIPVLQGNKPKQMMTTGAVTKMNYSDSKAGKKGEFHHTYGFVVVEIKDDETFYARQVTANDRSGSFTDLFYNVDNGTVSKITEIEGIVFGDIHYGSHEPEVIGKTHDFLTQIKPKHVVLHDIFDGSSINHHEMKDPFIQFSKEVNNKNSLRTEINGMLSWLEAFQNYENVVIVRSNHDDFVDRWLKNEDWRKLPTTKNSLEYMEYSTMLLKQYAIDPYNAKGVIPEVINRTYPNFITLGRNDSYRVKNWELGQHGDVGSNGSRGALNQFRLLNSKVIVGHSHAPGRKDGALSVGTSTKLRIGYNIGASSWLQSHVIIHKDGRAQHINFVKDANNEINFTTFNYKN